MNTTTRLALIAPMAIVMSLPAHAGKKEEAEAEHVRLGEEMKRLAQRNAWRGVEAAYVEMLDLERKGVVLTYKDHFNGAQAARALGDINGTYERLKRAQAVDASDEVNNWLKDIESNYGPVELNTDKKYKGETGLAVAEMPMQPDQRAAIEVAQTKAGEQRRYTGLLPVGTYTFGDETFDVRPGGGTVAVELGSVAVAVADVGPEETPKEKTPKETSPKETTPKETTPKEKPPKEETLPKEKTPKPPKEKTPKPPREPIEFAYIGPRLNLGPSFTRGTEARVPSPQPGSFGGIGGRVGGGLDIGFSNTLGAAVEVGYQNFFGAAGDEEGKLEATPEFTLEGDRFHLGYAWLAAVYNSGPISIAAGPSYTAGSGTVTGLSAGCVTNPTSPDCSGVSADRESLRYQRMTGAVRAGGGTLGVTYGFTELTDKLQGGVSLNLGASYDTARWYPWGQVAFTISPSRSKG